MWFTNYLYNRTQKVIVEGESSDYIKVTSGVPQGTVLGPLLFLLYINDLPDSVRCKIGLFADDSIVYSKITSINDCQLLQDDLDALTLWSKVWDMEFNTDKCKILSVTNKKNIINYNYKMENVSLKSVTEEKYLGVVIDKKLSWLPHVKKISNRANYKRQFLQRNLRSCKRETKLQCYKTYVRPVLEYASPVWDTNNKKVIENIESVQRKAIRFIMNDYKQDSSVTKMMKQLNIDPLDIRRKVKKLKLLRSILSQKVFLPNYVKPIRARDQIKLKPIYARIQSYAQSFIPSVTSEWNKLPSVVLKENNIKVFEEALYKVYRS
mgnify:CR=1 FL=1